GVRPEGELSKVLWSDLSFEGKPELTLRHSITKTNETRFIDLQPNTIAWLKLCLPCDEAALPSTPIMPFKATATRTRRTKQNRRLGIRFPKNAMRHTFCSCWLAKWEDQNKLMLQTGHMTPQMLRRNYNKGTKKAEAERFWNIFP